MRKELRFNGGEIVRLKDNSSEDGLKAGDCGLIWAAYNADPPFYEASFVDELGEFVDIRFYEEEVEELTHAEGSPFIAQLEKLRSMLEKVKPRD